MHDLRSHAVSQVSKSTFEFKRKKKLSIRQMMADGEADPRASSGLLGIASSLIKQRKYPLAEDGQQAISNGLCRGRYPSDKQAVLVRLELIEEETILYIGTTVDQLFLLPIRGTGPLLMARDIH